MAAPNLVCIKYVCKISLKKNAVNPSNFAKTEKTHGNITPEQQINPVQISHPSKAMFIPPFPGEMRSQTSGGDVEASI